MSHELTEIEGGHAFVYNVERGDPWHKLGTPVQGFMTIEEALEASKSNDFVELVPVYADGDDEPIPDHYATCSDVYGAMGVVGSKWEPVQRSEIMAIAASIVGMSDGEAVVDTMGNLGPRAQRFFCHIEFPELVIDPQGVADTIRRGLFVGTSFDGSMANTLGLSNIREVCANTVRMSLDRLAQAVRVKHAGDVDGRMYQAAAALGYAAAAEKALLKRAEQMLRIPGDEALDAALDHLWPTDPDEIGERALERREDIRDHVWELYEGPTNVGAVGPNGWAAYGAVTEWLDHYRPVRGASGEAAARRRAEQTLLDEASDVNKKKFAAAEAILALAD